jgi:hypothetical protein
VQNERSGRATLGAQGELSVNVPRASGIRCTRIALVVVTTCAVGVACAAKQRVPLDCVPEEVTVFVDQRALEELPESLELRSDRPHKVYLKGPGYEPQLIVLEPRRGESGKTTLHPDRICVELVPVGVDRQLTLEIEEDGDALPGALDADAATP